MAPRSSLVTDFSALPFPANSLDLVVLPHTLELSPDPHATLREVERVLVPEGRVVICGLNPASLWGMRQRRARLYQRLGFGELFLPDAGEFIGYRRMRDWLRLLSFEVESGRFGVYRPAVRSEAWLERCHWFDDAGERCARPNHVNRVELSAQQHHCRKLHAGLGRSADIEIELIGRPRRRIGSELDARRNGVH